MNLERKTQMAAVHTRLQSSLVYTLTRTDCAIGTVPTEPPIPLPPFWSTASQMLNLQSKVPDKGPLFCPWLMPPRQGGFSVSLSGPQTVWTSWQAVSLAPLNDVADLSRYLQAFQTGGIPSDSFYWRPWPMLFVVKNHYHHLLGREWRIEVGTVTRSKNGQPWSVRVRMAGHGGGGRWCFSP